MICLGAAVDIASSLMAEVPRSLRVVSFGQVVWMLEKAGLDPALTRRWDYLVLRCAENIARWWMLEHHEWPEGGGRVSFPGEVTMPQGLMPAVLWLGTRDYTGVWRHGGGEGRFRKLEIFGALGNSRTSVLYNVLLVYGTAVQNEPVWRPMWYRDNFNDWAAEILRLPHLPSLARHNLDERGHWCGVLWCPYPYVTKIMDPQHNLLVPENVTVLQNEDPSPRDHNWRILNPRWGAYLYLEGPQGAKPKAKDKEEDEEEEEEEEEGKGESGE